MGSKLLQWEDVRLCMYLLSCAAKQTIFTKADWKGVV